MSQNPTAYPPQQQGYYAPQPPPKKSHTLRNVLLILLALGILFVGGCFAVVGMAANEVGKSIDESVASDNKPGRANNAMAIKAGQAFEVDGFNYAKGWRVGKERFSGDVKITGLRVTNNRDAKDSAIVEIKFWKGSEVVALTDCSTEPIAPGTTTKLDCISADKLPKRYSKITINDSF